MAAIKHSSDCRILRPPNNIIKPLQKCYAAPMETNIRLILTSVDQKEAALHIARQLVEPGLAACVQISAPGTSVYTWQGELEQDTEYYLSIKTTPAASTSVISWLEEHHPYDTPEIICLDAEAGDAYLQWMRATIR